MRSTARGFTLIELLVVVSILGILMGVALPSFRSAYLSNKLASYSNDFVGAAQFARSEAIKRNSVLSLCASSDGATCTTSASSWQPGWIVKCNATSSTATACTSSGTSTLVLQKHDSIDSSYSMTTSGVSSGITTPYEIRFAAGGVGAGEYTVKLCSTNTSYSTQWREIKVLATGRANVARQLTAPSSCP